VITRRQLDDLLSTSEFFPLLFGLCAFEAGWTSLVDSWLTVEALLSSLLLEAGSWLTVDALLSNLLLAPGGISRSGVLSSGTSSALRARELSGLEGGSSMEAGKASWRFGEEVISRLDSLGLVTVRMEDLREGGKDKVSLEALEGLDDEMLAGGSNKDESLELELTGSGRVEADSYLGWAWAGGLLKSKPKDDPSEEAKPEPKSKSEKSESEPKSKSSLSVGGSGIREEKRGCEGSSSSPSSSSSTSSSCISSSFVESNIFSGLSCMPP
jgi:hypothetical protein